MARGSESAMRYHRAPNAVHLEGLGSIPSGCQIFTALSRITKGHHHVSHAGRINDVWK